MKANILASMMTIILMSRYLQAETIKKDPICKTTTECDKLTERLQTEIDGLEVKGIENLTDDEFIKLDRLLDQLLAAQKAKTAEIRKTNKKLDELSAMVK